MEHFEKSVSSEEIYCGNIIKVTKDGVILENGATATREVVRHKGAVAVLPIDKDGNAYFVKQFRYPFGRELLEVPAGKMEQGEIPLECAKRELMEECGFSAENWRELGPFYSSPGFCDEVIWFFVAENLSFVGQNPDEDEFLDVVKMPLSEAVKKVLNGSVPDGKTQALVMRGTQNG